MTIDLAGGGTVEWSMTGDAGTQWQWQALGHDDNKGRMMAMMALRQYEGNEGNEGDEGNEGRSGNDDNGRQ